MNFWEKISTSLLISGDIAGELSVKELLDDIWEYSQPHGGNDSAFYCLQPVVVVRGEDCWQVVDGQQRLTTLRLILHFWSKNT